MSEEYGNDFITLSDEDGNEMEFEHLDTMEYNGETYMAFIPAEMSLSDEAELVILKVVKENDEEVLISVDDELLLNTLFEEFIARLDEGEFYEQTEDVPPEKE